MSIGNLILGVNSVTVSYLIHYDSLIQNATDIVTKCDSYFIAKCDRSLLQNASVFLLQNASNLLQNAAVFTKCNNFITKCDVYYKLQKKAKKAPFLLDMPHISYIDETWHSYTLPKEDPKNT